MAMNLDRPEKNKPRDTFEHHVSEILKKSVVTTTEFERLHVVPTNSFSDRKLKLARNKEREKVKGRKWYGLPATELTDAIKNDLEILRMRSTLDPKRFYKKNDSQVLPKYFQMGKIMDSPLDYYDGRVMTKRRKVTLVDELLSDAEFNRYNKGKYKKVIGEQSKTHYKAWKKAKKLKQKK